MWSVMSFQKNRYKDLCDSNPSMPIFSNYWWLNLVSGEDGWDVVIVENGGEIIGALPYAFKRKLNHTIITMPPLTQSLGPWIRYPKQQKYERKLAYEKRVIMDLIAGLPKFSVCKFNCSSGLTNWLPFYWKGFSQTTRYTYVIHNDTDDESLENGFKSSVRNKIKKAESIVTVNSDLSIREFYELNRKTFSRQNLMIPYSFDMVVRKDDELEKRNQRKIFFAMDVDNNLHSALYLIWDNETAYVHMVGEDPLYRNSGAGNLLIKVAIKYAFDELKLSKFDFEGSMIESVEEVRRAFGAIQTPYFTLSKVNSLPLTLLMSFKQYFQR